MEELLHNSNFLLFLRLANIILITLAISAWSLFYKRYKLIMAIAPITWLVHVLIYGTYRFMNTPHYGNYIVLMEKNEYIMDVWTALVLMHGIILLLVSAMESIPKIKGKKERKEDN